MLQVLTECKQNAQFAGLLARLEKKPACKGRSLEIFLTYPMHQASKYGRAKTCNVFYRALMRVYCAVDPPVHHHPARAAGPHPARPCREKFVGTRPGPGRADTALVWIFSCSATLYFNPFFVFVWLFFVSL